MNSFIVTKNAAEEIISNIEALKKNDDTGPTIIRR